MSELEAGGCGVCIDADGEQPDFMDERIVTARKPQKCCECRDIIPAGAKYEYVAGKWEGEFSTYKTCLVCREIRRALCCNGWVYGQLWEGAQEVFEGLTTGCLEQLETAAAKAKLLEEWRRWKGLE